jgi:hypothetical protein
MVVWPLWDTISVNSRRLRIRCLPIDPLEKQHSLLHLDPITVKQRGPPNLPVIDENLGPAQVVDVELSILELDASVLAEDRGILHHDVGPTGIAADDIATSP